MKSTQPSSVGPSEIIIAVQSAILALMGLAGMMAVGPVNAGFRALRDKESMVAIITDDGITSDKVQVDLSQVQAIVRNYEFVCLLAMCIGGLVFLASLGRIYLKRNAKTPTSTAPDRLPKRPAASARGKSRR